LSPLEERLVAPRLPFIQIRLVGCRPEKHSFLDLIAKLMNELCPKTNQFTSLLDYLRVENFKSFCQAVWSENRHGRIFKVIHPL